MDVSEEESSARAAVEEEDEEEEEKLPLLASPSLLLLPVAVAFTVLFVISAGLTKLSICMLLANCGNLCSMLMASAVKLVILMFCAPSKSTSAPATRMRYTEDSLSPYTVAVLPPR